MKTRAAAFIDGFNLYHAVDDSRQSQFKWLDLCALIEVFVPASQFDLVAVYYFSAYATWRANAYKRHREYVKALQANGVTPVMGQFKKKSRTCFSCGAKWETHEEKEGTNIVRLDPDVAKEFPDAAAVNDALRKYLREKKNSPGTST
ncbi:MAG: hypothetical protein OER85_12895 [Gammaproteobacteria bacterium]|nr:hypothetical protein [Gammaproteobacteria bacterium]